MHFLKTEGPGSLSLEEILTIKVQDEYQRIGDVYFGRSKTIDHDFNIFVHTNEPTFKTPNGTQYKFNTYACRTDLNGVLPGAEVLLREFWKNVRWEEVVYLQQPLIVEKEEDGSFYMSLKATAIPHDQALLMIHLEDMGNTGT